MLPSTHAIESALWSMALSGEPIDSSALALALEREAAEKSMENLDCRTRLLIRDSLNALGGLWRGALGW